MLQRVREWFHDVPAQKGEMAFSARADATRVRESLNEMFDASTEGALADLQAATAWTAEPWLADRVSALTYWDPAANV